MRFQLAAVGTGATTSTLRGSWKGPDSDPNGGLIEADRNKPDPTDPNLKGRESGCNLDRIWILGMESKNAKISIDLV